MTTDQMIKLLERRQRVPGTVIIRALSASGGIVWSVGIGEMQQRKEIQEGPTIRSALMKFPAVKRAIARLKS